MKKRRLIKKKSLNDLTTRLLIELGYETEEERDKFLDNHGKDTQEKDNN